MSSQTRPHHPDRRKKNQHLEDMLEGAVTRALEKQAQPDHVCRFDESMTSEKHRKHHELIDAAMETLARLNNTKWGVFGVLAKLTALGVLGVFGWEWFKK